eukprot:166844-Chlamydomonas_euryale.AAC.1
MQGQDRRGGLFWERGERKLHICCSYGLRGGVGGGNKLCGVPMALSTPYAPRAILLTQSPDGLLSCRESAPHPAEVRHIPQPAEGRHPTACRGTTSHSLQRDDNPQPAEALHTTACRGTTSHSLQRDDTPHLAEERHPAACLWPLSPLDRAPPP